MSSRRLSVLAVVLSFVLATTWLSSSLYSANDPNGGGDPPPPPTTIQDIQDCFDGAVDAGTIEGTLEGKGRSFRLREINLWQMSLAIEDAQLAWDEGDFEKAYGWLSYAYLRCDGLALPLGDWVSGPGVPELKDKILDVMVQIGPAL